MSKIVPARFLSGLICAAMAVAWPIVVFAAGDEPAKLTEDVSDAETPPPGGVDESSDRSDRGGHSTEQTSVPAAEPTPTQSPQVDRVSDREAAKRALLADPNKDKNKPNPLLDDRGPDYYDRRAKELLAQDADQGRVDLHPLMQAHPDSYVVVCTGGCRDGASAQIVSLLPKRNSTPVPATEDKSERPQISCVGGCGNGNVVSFASAPKPYTDKIAVAATVGEWVTTVAKVPAGAGVPAPKPAQSGGWMDTINRDREAAKVARALPEGKKPGAPVASKSSDGNVVIAEAKPVAPGSAAKPIVPAQAKPAPEAKSVAMADVKPAAPVAKATAPIEVKAVDTKPAEAKAAEAKPADAKPVVASTPVIVAQTTIAAPAEAKPVGPVAEIKPAPLVSAKPIIAIDANVTAAADKAPVPAAAKSLETKSATSAQVAAPPVTDMKLDPVVPAKPAGIADANSKSPMQGAPAPKQMAALEQPKTSISPVTSQPIGPAPVAPTARSEAKLAAPSPAAVAVPTPAERTTKPETKVAALEPPAPQKPASAAPVVPKERVISVLSEDKEMNAAIQSARHSIASFWRSYDGPGPGEADHALKVAVAGNGTTEHFWLTRIKREGDKISGVISNQPQSVKTVRIGQRYVFSEDMISDWTFKRNGKLVGNETMRVLLPRMPEEQAAVYRQMYETP